MLSHVRALERKWTSGFKGKELGKLKSGPFYFRDTKQALDTLVALDENEAAAVEYRDRIDAMATKDAG